MTEHETTTIHIDGRDGGGQILRSSLSLAALMGRPLRIENIRGKRKKDGLLRQHLTAVKAAATVCAGRLEGAALRSTQLTFVPGAVRGGNYHFAVGSAGSAVLVAQTVLPILMGADGPSVVVFEGGTHNPMAPPYEFLERVFFPALAEMGVTIESRLERAGFFPAGGGRFVVAVTPGMPRTAFERTTRTGEPTIEAWALSAHIPGKVGEREMRVVREAFDLSRHACRAKSVPSPGPGNAVSIELRCGAVVERVTAFGRKGLAAEKVAEMAVAEARSWLASKAPVGEHLTDQLLLPLAFAGGTFRTATWSNHARTNTRVIRAFLGDAALTVEHGDDGLTTVTAPGR